MFLAWMSPYLYTFKLEAVSVIYLERHQVKAGAHRCRIITEEPWESGNRSLIRLHLLLLIPGSGVLEVAETGKGHEATESVLVVSN